MDLSFPGGVSETLTLARARGGRGAQPCGHVSWESLLSEGHGAKCGDCLTFQPSQDLDGPLPLGYEPFSQIRPPADLSSRARMAGKAALVLENTY